jgi:hypothetical protein
MAGGDSLNYHALFYDLVDDCVSHRAEFPQEHLRLAREAQRRSQLLLAGALTDPTDRALLVFRAPDRSGVEQFARNNPLRYPGA